MELRRGLIVLETLEPPSRQNAGSGAISTMDRCTGGATLGACVLLTLRVGCIGLSGHDPHPSRVNLEADQLDRMATRHVERVVVVGANARTYEQRMDRRMRRTKIRQGDALEVPSERRITIRTTTALTNTSLKGFCICSSCRRCGCRYKVTNRTTRAGLGLKRLQPLVARPRCTSRRRSASKLPHRSFVAGSG